MIPDMTTGMRDFSSVNESRVQGPSAHPTDLHDQIRSEGADAGNSDARLGRTIGRSDT